MPTFIEEGQQIGVAASVVGKHIEENGTFIGIQAHF